MNQINRLKLNSDCKKSPSLLDCNIERIEEDNFSFQDVKDKVAGIFKKDDDKDSSNSNTSRTVKEKSGVGLGILTGIIGIAGSLIPVLPSLGVGSKSRINETNAISSANMLTLDTEKQREKTLFLMGGMFLVAMLIIFIALKK